MGGDSSVFYVVNIESNGVTMSLVRSNTTTTIITSLTPGVTYQFKVLARN
jgi:hypothetical protein